MESDLKCNPKRFWSVLSHKSKLRNIPEAISLAADIGQSEDQRRIQANNPQDIADLFNRHFASIFTSDEGTQFDTDSQDLPEPALVELTLSCDEVLSVLKRLDVNKATGPDNIPGRILKESVDVIAPSLCELFNKSIRLGVVPEEWKCTKIVPVFQKDNKDHAENYRPISLLSLVSKVMERCVFNAIKEHIATLITRCQHGFIAGRSCVTQ